MRHPQARRAWEQLTDVLAELRRIGDKTSTTQVFEMKGKRGLGQADVRAVPDGQLWLLRDTYARQTAWAPVTSEKAATIPA